MRSSIVVRTFSGTEYTIVAKTPDVARDRANEIMDLIENSGNGFIKSEPMASENVFYVRASAIESITVRHREVSE